MKSLQSLQSLYLCQHPTLNPHRDAAPLPVPQASRLPNAGRRDGGGTSAAPPAESQAAAIEAVLADLPPADFLRFA